MHGGGSIASPRRSASLVACLPPTSHIVSNIASAYKQDERFCEGLYERRKGGEWATDLEIG
jgi:hypothetical protein